ncbi:hypothetical protein WMY93_018293 [Mugilogobius chulae]|uniref:Uncharacterized protein n=1 Tax=Mugilogobius chulae TaxID=88201 RepID=A0AAW0NVP5_9GOBI
MLTVACVCNGSSACETEQMDSYRPLFVPTSVTVLSLLMSQLTIHLHGLKCEEVKALSPPISGRPRSVLSNGNIARAGGCAVISGSRFTPAIERVNLSKGERPFNGSHQNH